MMSGSACLLSGESCRLLVMEQPQSRLAAQRPRRLRPPHAPCLQVRLPAANSSAKSGRCRPPAADAPARASSRRAPHAGAAVRAHTPSHPHSPEPLVRPCDHAARYARSRSIRSHLASRSARAAATHGVSPRVASLRVG